MNWTFAVLIVVIIFLVYRIWGARIKKYIDTLACKRCARATEYAPLASASADAFVDADTETFTSGPGDTSADAISKAESEIVPMGIVATNNGTSVASACANAADATCAHHAGDDSFNKWLQKTTIDEEAVLSHKQYVADRLAGAEGTGGPMIVDRHESYDVVPWYGLSRPQRVPIRTPQQVPDIDVTRYPKAQSFRITTGVYS